MVSEVASEVERLALRQADLAVKIFAVRLSRGQNHRAALAGTLAEVAERGLGARRARTLGRILQRGSSVGGGSSQASRPGKIHRSAQMFTAEDAEDLAKLDRLKRFVKSP